MPTPPTIRRQLTLFVPEPWRADLDVLRRTLDPVQASLISAHVTLCREDEIQQLDPSEMVRRVEAWPHGPLTLTFGVPQRFNGHGVLLPCDQGAMEFHALRRWLLDADEVRSHAAHLTLAHPRNPRAVGNTDRALAGCPHGLFIRFPTVTLIEQQGADPWCVVQHATLGGMACR